MAAIRLRSIRLAFRALLLLCAALADTAAAEPLPGPGQTERLRIPDNPGRLDAYLYVPEQLAEPAAPAALVVALHGCRQRASDFDDETGWRMLADEAGFLLLLPEQRWFNNPRRCFNWFNPWDYDRNRGEPASIRQAVEVLFERFPIDRNRVFVTGLSAGGGMTSVLLATHPDLFAGDAQVELWITAGVGHATSIDEEAGCGRDDPQRKSDYVKDTGLCTSRYIARFWGLVEQRRGTDGRPCQDDTDEPGSKTSATPLPTSLARSGQHRCRGTRAVRSPSGNPEASGPQGRR